MFIQGTCWGRRVGRFTAGVVPPGSVRGSVQQHLAQGKGAEKKVVCNPCALPAGKHIGSFVLVALSFSAGPARIPGGGWVWGAVQGALQLRGWCGHSRACSSTCCKQPLCNGFCRRAVLLAAFVDLLIV